MDEKIISIVGARENNLANLTCDIPRGKFVVVCGPSGSGKSSLVFDTLYREAVWRFFTAPLLRRGRSFGVLRRPAVDRIAGLSFVFASEANRRFTPFGSAATLADCYEMLAILFEHLAIPVCPNCNEAVDILQKIQLVELVQAYPLGTDISLFAPLGDKHAGELKGIATFVGRKGFTRVEVGQEVMAIDSLDTLDYLGVRSVSTLVDKFSLSEGSTVRLLEGIDLALDLSKNEVKIFVAGGKMPLRYFETPRCANCQATLLPLSHESFLYYHPAGACPQCRGRGRGESKRLKGRKRFDEAIPCRECHGMRLRREAAVYRLCKQGFGELLNGSMSEALSWSRHVKAVGVARLWQEKSKVAVTLSTDRREMLEHVVEELLLKLSVLDEVGLGYLELARPVDTLSRGEYQRCLLTRQLASSLQGVLYLFDEPTIGLHPRDTATLQKMLKRLVDAGNSVIVIEHDPDIIRGSDYLLELGPAAGAEGGRLVFSGTVTDEKGTAPFYSKGGKRALSPFVKALKISEAKKYNLKNLTLDVPLQKLIAVTGVSGSGKTTLIVDSLVPALREVLRKRRGRKGPDTVRFSSREQAQFGMVRIAGFQRIRQVVDVKELQKPTGNRSIVGTLAKVVRPLRELFSQTVEAQIRGFGAEHFSFNRLGACERCNGEGFETAETRDGASISLSCSQCLGRRFTHAIEQVRFKGMSISDVLNLTVKECASKFSNHQVLAQKLAVLIEVGLGYLRLSQRTSTLSSGELQRIRLAADISDRGSGGCLYVFDEPTEGLHWGEVGLLISLLHRLVAANNSVIVIEHNIQLIQSADYIIDLGPGAGEAGGLVVASGTPEEMRKMNQSSIGRYL